MEGRRGIVINLQLFADSGEKTEKATSKKRRDLRRKGQVFHSKEAATNVVLLLMFLSLKTFGGYIYTTTQNLLRVFLVGEKTYKLDDVGDVMSLFTYVLIEIAKILAPLFLVAMLAGALGYYLQVGFLFTTDPIRPKFSNINPISGLKQLFSTRALFELAKSVLKIILIGYVAYTSIRGEMNNLLKLMTLEVGPLAAYLVNTAIDIGIKICFALLIITVVDFFFQWRKHEKDIRMTKQEVKEEFKQIEGNPEIKGKIKQKQREISMRRMLNEVPKADVVITNPTHYAVAIKYEPQRMSAPYVIAKGVDFMAKRIKDTAKKNKINIVENRPLAQALYNTVEIGAAVPPELYKAVAEVLAFVYNLQGKKP